MLIGYPVPGKAKAKMLCDAFIAGAPRNAEGAVFYGVKQGNHADWLRVKAKGIPYWFIDNSYFDQTRGTQFRVTHNALQWHGHAASSGARWGRIASPILPWQEDRAGYILVCPQSEDHMRFTLGYQGDWLKDILGVYGRAGYDVRIRAWSADKPHLMRSLADDLAHASVLITHTSAAAVMATLAGIPVICDPQCAAHGIDPAGDRLWWARALADNQFTLDEMKDGTAWAMLHK